MMPIMSSRIGTKINHLLRVWPKGTIAVQFWLDQQGVDRKLMDAYVRSGWVDRIAPGAYIQAGDRITWLGALYTLQSQLGISIHVAATSALHLSGLGHYLPLGQNVCQWLFIDASETRKIPKWFKDQFTQHAHIMVVRTKLFQDKLTDSLLSLPQDNFHIVVAAPERAIMECLYLTPDRLSFEHASTLLEQARTLRPSLVQDHLVNCSSIKVKRLFLYLSELHQHTWLSRIDLDNIFLGTGGRKIGTGGNYIAKYKLSVPQINQHGGYNHDKNDQ